MTPPARPAVWIIIALMAVQAVDIAAHVATGQIEPLRLASNAVLLAWALAVGLGRAPGWTTLASLIIYALLNGGFLVLNGVTNPDMDDALRLPLFILVGASLGLTLAALGSAWPHET